MKLPAGLLERGPALADHDALLALVRDVDHRADPQQLLRLLEGLDSALAAVRHLRQKFLLWGAMS